jgi:hypothetical protein
MLAILISKSKDLGHVSGVVSHLVDDGLSILNMQMTQYFFLKMINKGLRI